ncbi:MAG: class I SAM-dependent methyltransferase [Pseudomonadota bacterium]
MKALLKGLAQRGLGLVPSSLVAPLVRALCALEAGRRPPREAAAFLLGLDEALYPLLSQAAVAAGGGTHVKHRLTAYHDFFVGRVAPGQRVLDVGCGVGALAQDLAQRGQARVTAIDNNPQAIERARALHPHPGVEYLLADALRPLPQAGCEVIALSNVLEHLPQRVEFLRDLLAAQRPRRLLIRVPLLERDWRVAWRRELGLEWRLDNTHHTEYTLESFALEMAQAGLEVTHQEVRWGEIWAEARPVAA